MGSSKHQECSIVRLMATSLKNGFYKSKSESILYVKKQGNFDILIIALYVDDLVFTRNNIKMKT